MQVYIKTTFKKMWKYRAIYMVMIPGLIWYVVFAYIPMGGLSLAFKDYKANLGILNSPWSGTTNFGYVFQDTAFWRSISRTLVINVGRLLTQFPAPIILAILLNELRIGRYKRILQSLFTFPSFLSWVIVASIMTNVLSMDGVVNSFASALGGTPVNFLGNPKFFQPLLYFTEIWKSSGYSAIIYLASISGIDVEQYEAAEIDGARRIQRMFYITLPNLIPTITVLFILMCGNLMSTGFDQIFNLSNAAVRSVAETLDMYIYRITFQTSVGFSYASAVALFRSVVNMLLLLFADRASRIMGGSGLMS